MGSRILMACLLSAAVAAVTLAPAGSATSYNLCTPGDVACVVQDDSRYAGEDCDAQPYRYSTNRDFTGFVVNAGPASASAGGHFSCDNWFYNDSDYHGLFATARVGDATAEAYWRSYDVDYHWPGAPEDRYGEYIIVRANDGSGYTGVDWRTTTASGGTTCDTTLMVMGSGTSLGCPAGGPPEPPTQEWGNVLP